MLKKPIYFVYFCWLIAAISTLGSLFFSEVMEYPPCVLCWYQRIAMYPLVLLFWIGASERVSIIYKFTMPFSLIGFFIAAYHNLLHYEIIPEDASPCTEGVSCSTVYIELFGFITIPMMSLFAFGLITTLLIGLKRNFKNE